MVQVSYKVAVTSLDNEHVEHYAGGSGPCGSLSVVSNASEVQTLLWILV